MHISRDESRKSLALKVASIVGVSGSGVLCVLWVRTQRPATAREGRASCDDGVGRRALLNPVDDCSEHVEMIERWASAAVGHAGNEEHAAPFGYFVSAAIRCGKRLVISESVER